MRAIRIFILLLSVWLPCQASTHRSVLQYPVRSLDPVQTIDSNGQLVLTNAYDGLVAWDAERGISPALASRWDFDADGLKITFHLRPGARFHDSSRVNAESVRRHFIRIKSSTSYFESHFANLRLVTATEPSTVVFELKRADSQFLQLLAGSAGRIVTRDSMGRWVGSGPFKPSLEDDGRKVVLDRDPDYWGPKPPMTRIEFTALSETEAVERALTGRTDDLAVMSLPPNEHPRLLDSGRWITQPMWTTWIVGFDQRVPPLDDKAVREELSAALRADDFVQTLFKDQLKASGLIPYGMPGYREWTDAPSKPMRRPTPAANPASFNIEVPDLLAKRAQITDWLTDRLSRLRLSRPRVINTPFEDMMRRYAKGRIAAFLVGINSEYPDPSFILRALKSNSTSNFLGVRTPLLDAMLEEAEGTSDRALQARLLRRVNDHLIDEAALVPLMHVIHHAWVRHCVTGLRLSPIGDGYFDFRSVENTCR